MRGINQKPLGKGKQRGVGIIEVLVALVVVSFGVLGMASLQLTGMKHSTGGFNRSKALLYAENIASRMRINESGVDKLFYADYDSNGTDCTADIPAKICQATPGNLNPDDCSDQDLAVFDLYTMACGDIGNTGADNGVLSALPEGQLTVVCDDAAACDADSSHTISILWLEGSVSSDDKTAQVNRRVQVRLQP